MRKLNDFQIFLRLFYIIFTRVLLRLYKDSFMSAEKKLTCVKHTLYITECIINNFFRRGNFPMYCTYTSLNQMRRLRKRNILKDDGFKCEGKSDVPNTAALESDSVMRKYFGKLHKILS